MRISFLGNLTNGFIDSEEALSYARTYAAVYISLMAVLFPVTRFCYWEFFRVMFMWLTGWSLLSVAFFLSLIIILNIPVTYVARGSAGYKLTAVWGIALVALSIVGIHYSAKLRDRYSFQCETFWVDRESGTYHIDFHDRCLCGESLAGLENMKGHEMEKQLNSFELCEDCEQWAEDAEDSYQTERFIRR